MVIDIRQVCCGPRGTADSCRFIQSNATELSVIPAGWLFAGSWAVHFMAEFTHLRHSGQMKRGICTE